MIHRRGPETPDVPASPFSQLQSFGRVYAFLDLEHPAVAWAVMRGMLMSAAHASHAPGFISFMQAGMILAGNNPRIFNEAIIELYRASGFPRHASRMQGMYFFQSATDAERRIGDRNWPSYFVKDNLIELDLLCDTAPTIVDANWITFANLDPSGKIAGDLDWIIHYWQGRKRGGAPVWELIAQGVALVLDESVRRRCHAYLEDMFPQARIPILMARLASETGTRGGFVHPFLLREGEDAVRLGYLWSDVEFHDPVVINGLAKHPDSKLLCQMISQNDTWHIPDFRPWGRVFRLGVALPELGNVIPSVHNSK